MKKKLKFGSKYKYNYLSGEHNCHVCKKGIKNNLQLHHHAQKKSKGGKSTKAVHAKCHAKSHGNYNHVLTDEDRRKAGLKTYRQNLRNMSKHNTSSNSIKRGLGTHARPETQAKQVGPTIRSEVRSKTTESR